MAAALSSRLLAYLQESRLFEPPGLALLAVSGGLDSVALLDLMCFLKAELELDLAVAHIAHGISDEAAEAVPKVRELARTYEIPFYMEELALGGGATETVARKARYEALRSIQDRLRASYVATAHHQDDQVETVLFRFLRGSGVAGLAGISPSGPNGLVRPLLNFSKAELEAWLLARYPDPSCRPPLFDDPANADVRHDRSWLRHELLPILRRRFGSTLDSRLVDVGIHAKRNNAAWGAVLETLPDLELRHESESIELARAPLRRYDKLLSECILRTVAREVGCRIGQTRAKLLLDFATGGISGRSMQLGMGWEATLVFEKVRIWKTSQSELPKAVKVEFVPGGEGRFSWGEWVFSWQSEPAGSSRRDSNTTWLVCGAYDVRAPRPGDRILPLGGVGSRKLRRLLMEARIPVSERTGIPVFTQADRTLWVPGICRSADLVPGVGEPAVRLDADAG